MEEVQAKKGSSDNPLEGVVSFDMFDHLFTEPAAALAELERRRKDIVLQTQIRGALKESGRGVPDIFVKPYAILFRQLATPTHEILHFIKVAEQLNLSPLIFEYLGDKLVSSGNRYKRSLGKMPIFTHRGSDGRDAVKYQAVCDFNLFSGKEICTVHTFSGDTLVSFHHKLFEKVTGRDVGTNCFDATDWFRFSENGRARGYYQDFLSLFVRDAILFENYFTTPSEIPLVQESVAPAFHAVERLFGHKPLIARLLPENKELKLFWDSYPKEVLGLI